MAAKYLQKQKFHYKIYQVTQAQPLGCYCLHACFYSSCVTDFLPFPFFCVQKDMMF